MNFRADLKACGFNQTSFAELTGVNRRTVSRWKEEPPAWAHLLVIALLHLSNEERAAIVGEWVSQHATTQDASM